MKNNSDFFLALSRRIGSSFLVHSALLTIFFTLFHSGLPAREQELRFRNISIEQGLSHSKVNCIYQDRQGFLWFGTNEGLNKFDGYSFTVYQQDPDNPNSISANLIRCILEDSRGNLWIGTEAGGLNHFDRDTRQFSHFDADSASSPGIGGNNVNTIIEDSSGRLWLGTEHGIILFDPLNRVAENYLPYPGPNAAPSLNDVMVLYEDSRHTIWIGTMAGGICSFDPEALHFTSYMHDDDNQFSVSDNEIHSIHEDPDGNLWIGTTYGGLNLFDRKKQRFFHYYPDRNDPESTTIRAITDAGQGALWVGNRVGLNKFDCALRQFTHYTHDPNNPNSLIQNSVQAIFKDAKGDYWIGTRGGISHLNTSNLPFVHYRANANNRHYLNKQAVYAILEDRNGDLWFGTEHGGLNYLNRRNGLFTYYMHNNNNPNSLSVNNIKTLLEDRDGNLWIGTFDGGLNRFDRKTNTFTHFFHDDDNPASIAIDNVISLLEDKNGDILVGTYGGGLDRLNKKTGRFKHLLQHWQKQGFYNINCMLRDRKGNLWVGAGQGKIGRLDARSGALKPYRLRNAMQNVEVMSALEDSQGRLWFGTVGRGLYLMDPDAESFRSYTRKDGLPGNVVNSILEDDSGNLWLSTTDGLCRFNPETGQIKSYYRENGLQSDQFNYNAHLVTRDGEMFFGGIYGVTSFYPERIRENAYIPPVVITGFEILNKPVRIGGQNAVLTRDISRTDAIRLSYRQSVFSFEFVALNYAISEQNQYAYKLEGFDEDWNDVGNRRFATYTNIDPGEYTFRVKAANNDGLWNEKGTSLKITILPPFWKTIWFKIIIIALILLTIKHFIDYLRQKRNLLHAKSLANLAQLKLLRNQMNPHFLFNALGSIRSMILISKERAWDMVSELSEFFRYTMLNFNKVEALLDDEINAVHNYLNIERVRYKDSLQVCFRIDEEARKCLVPAFICQPLIENAIKYGMQTSPMPLQVNISISFKDDLLSIDVSNTGKMIDFKHSREADADGHGNSLQNIRQRLGIMFKDKYSFNLFEDAGWVHTKISINCKKDRKAPLFAPKEETLLP